MFNGASISTSKFVMIFLAHLSRRSGVNFHISTSPLKALNGIQQNLSEIKR